MDRPESEHGTPTTPRDSVAPDGTDRSRPGLPPLPAEAPPAGYYRRLKLGWWLLALVVSLGIWAIILIF